jgi:hypothetical protein
MYRRYRFQLSDRSPSISDFGNIYEHDKQMSIIVTSLEEKIRKFLALRLADFSESRIGKSRQVTDRQADIQPALTAGYVYLFESFRRRV